jgi:hypothetical protein
MEPPQATLDVESKVSFLPKLYSNNNLMLLNRLIFPSAIVWFVGQMWFSMIYFSQNELKCSSLNLFNTMFNLACCIVIYESEPKPKTNYITVSCRILSLVISYGLIINTIIYNGLDESATLVALDILIINTLVFFFGVLMFKYNKISIYEFNQTTIPSFVMLIPMYICYYEEADYDFPEDNTIQVRARPDKSNIFTLSQEVRHVFIHSLEERITKADDICSICLEDLKDTPVKVLSCKHEFHTGCISKWIILHHPNCPLCRNNFMV